MTNALLGWGLVLSVGAAVLGGITNANDDYYMFVGLAYAFFGIWGGIRLIKSNA